MTYNTRNVKVTLDNDATISYINLVIRRTFLAIEHIHKKIVVSRKHELNE